MKLGNIRSPWRYEAETSAALQSPQLRRTAFLCDAFTPIRDVGDDHEGGHDAISPCDLERLTDSRRSSTLAPADLDLLNRVRRGISIRNLQQ
jgi:hypothetical protein